MWLRFGLSFKVRIEGWGFVFEFEVWAEVEVEVWGGTGDGIQF